MRASGRRSSRRSMARGLKRALVFHDRGRLERQDGVDGRRAAGYVAQRRRPAQRGELPAGDARRRHRPRPLQAARAHARTDDGGAVAHDGGLSCGSAGADTRRRRRALPLRVQRRLRRRKRRDADDARAHVRRSRRPASTRKSKCRGGRRSTSARCGRGRGRAATFSTARNARPPRDCAISAWSSSSSTRSAHRARRALPRRRERGRTRAPTAAARSTIRRRAAHDRRNRAGGVSLPAGTFYISLAQPLANLVAAALEPDSQNSLAANRQIPQGAATRGAAFAALHVWDTP